jgi:hypothetical protein
LLFQFDFVRDQNGEPGECAAVAVNGRDFHFSKPAGDGFPRGGMHIRKRQAHRVEVVVQTDRCGGHGCLPLPIGPIVVVPCLPEPTPAPPRFSKIIPPNATQVAITRFVRPRRTCFVAHLSDQI